MNKVILTGNAGSDAEMRFTPSEDAVTTFPLAVTDGYGDHKKTLWYKITAWGKLAETCNNYVKKGSKVLVEGRLTADDSGNPRVWTRSDGTPGASFEVTSSTVEFLSGKEETF
jgi:single-strand DNA-binding protein